MPQAEKHLKWCLKDPRRLAKTKPDIMLAQKHLKKSEYNYGVETSIDLGQLKDVKELAVKIQRETIRVLGE